MLPLCVLTTPDSSTMSIHAGEGCYRCANNGNCTAPDVCTCAKGWTG
jgi:hypothetical protein